MRAAGATRRSPRDALVLAGGCFIALSLAVALLGSLPADVAVRNALLSVASPLVLAIAHVVNYAGTWVVLLPATALLLVLVRRAPARWWLWVALMLAAPTVESAVKRVVGRSRPEQASMGLAVGRARRGGARPGARRRRRRRRRTLRHATARLSARDRLSTTSAGRARARRDG